MKKFVLDCSVAMSWFFEDEKNKKADELLANLDKVSAVVPGLWRYEVSDVLLVALRRGRISEAQATRFLEMLNFLPIEVEADISLHRNYTAFNLAREHELSYYDAAYLELAIHRNLPLASLDKKLVVAGKKAGIEIIQLK